MRSRDSASVVPSITRSTRQQRAIKEVLGRESRPLAPPEILALVAESLPATGLTTVYRSLKRLVEEGEAVVVDIPGQAPRYEVAGKPHHHHFLCLACNRAYDVAGCREALLRGAPKGFEVLAHEVMLSGRCRDCRRAPGCI